MDSGTITAIITGIGGLVGGGGIVAAGKVWLDSRKQDTDHALAEDAQAVSQYSGLVERLEQRIQTLEKNHTDCLNDKAEMMRALGQLEGRVDEQREAMHKLRNENQKQNMQALEVAAGVAAKGVEVAANLARSEGRGPISVSTERIP